jgi:hypothetical protein
MGTDADGELSQEAKDALCARVNGNAPKPTIAPSDWAELQCRTGFTKEQEAIQREVMGRSCTVPTRQDVAKDRDEKREAMGLHTEFIPGLGGDGVHVPLRKVCEKLIATRDGLALSNLQPNQTIVFCVTTDGTDHGRATKHELQGGTVRWLNYADGARSSEHTILYSIARTKETKKGMYEVFDNMDTSMAGIVASGMTVQRRLTVDGKARIVDELHPVQFLLCGDEKARGCECGLGSPGASTSGACNECLIKLEAFQTGAAGPFLLRTPEQHAAAAADTAQLQAHLGLEGRLDPKCHDGCPCMEKEGEEGTFKDCPTYKVLSTFVQKGTLRRADQKALPQLKGKGASGTLIIMQSLYILAGSLRSIEKKAIFLSNIAWRPFLSID